MIISISGRIGSGKDLTGQIIQYLYYVYSDIHKDNKLSFEAFVKIDRVNNLLINGVVPKIKKWADSIKDMTCIAIGCTREQLEDIDFKNTGIKDLNNITPRTILQSLGTEWGRNMLHNDIWVNALMSKHKCTSCDMLVPFEDGIAHVEWDTCVMPNWIITDTRFPNEAKAVTDKGGINIRLTRNSNNPATHESETSLDNYSFDYVINNDNGDIPELIERIREILLIEKII